MISRRLIRVKTFQVLFSKKIENRVDFDQSYKELQKSFNKTKDLYFLLLSLLTELKHININKIEIRKSKLLAQPEDLNPKMNFVNNTFIKNIENNKQFQRYQNANIENWEQDETFLNRLYETLQADEKFIAYQNLEQPNFKQDKKIITHIFNHLLGENTEILDILEEKSIYWTEDFEFVINVILKTIRVMRSQTDEEADLVDLFKDESDQEFAYNLLKFTLQNQDEYSEKIEQHITNWDLERVIQVDVLLIQMALTELIHMPSVPIKVSIDEYVELSKFYSSEKSKIFINGMLDKLIKVYQEEGKIQKRGRGLLS